MEESRVGDTLRRALFQRSFKQRQCSHLGSIEQTSPERFECAACLEEGTVPVHMRMCLVCGEVACCDSSPGLHARRHYEETGHPLIRSIEEGEQWVWCYPDRAYLSRAPE
ncbi:MAG: UBP-type zinc finger domain-containing protein [Acidimicrobiia bacterium]|nr:UBP-type zinc finger domain-containing protein [Acidimicrobiia bacterium]MDH3397143.1 UBP-type zinc finger domain-containing protein [Acidimicrobiia bacterium]